MIHLIENLVYPSMRDEESNNKANKRFCYNGLHHFVNQTNSSKLTACSVRVNSKIKLKSLPSIAVIKSFPVLHLVCKVFAMLLLPPPTAPRNLDPSQFFHTRRRPKPETHYPMTICLTPTDFPIPTKIPLHYPRKNYQTLSAFLAHQL